MHVNSPSSHISLSYKTPYEQGISNQVSSKSSSSREQNSSTQGPLSSRSREDLQQEISQQRELLKLRSLDREVRAHELAHLAAAGKYATSGASFNFEKGPDGRLYAVSGEVGIDTSPVAGDPQASLRKAQAIMRAALAPANPSSQDRRVAAQANALAQQARIELALQQHKDISADKGENLDVFV